MVHRLYGKFNGPPSIYAKLFVPCGSKSLLDIMNSIQLGMWSVGLGVRDSGGDV